MTIVKFISDDFHRRATQSTYDLKSDLSVSKSLNIESSYYCLVITYVTKHVQLHLCNLLITYCHLLSVERLQLFQHLVSIKILHVINHLVSVTKLRFCDIRYDKTIIIEQGEQLSLSDSNRSIFSSPTATNLSLNAMFAVCWIKGSNYNWKHVMVIPVVTFIC
jgi:hypothetical protein